MNKKAKPLSLLYQVNSPADLRQLAESQLPELACELRQFLIDTLNQCGGHFGANLGTVELAIALHYAFNTPEDKLCWDVGHQAYPHKVLTGRRDQLQTIRQTAGLAPFLSRDESIYDCFGVGHSSTSISAAMGMAIAAAMDHVDHKSVAIIGDGGLTGGMAFEALNHAGSLDLDLLVILNDNDMSISPNVGALTNYFTRIVTSSLYTGVREQSKKVLANLPSAQQVVKRTETHLKGMITPGTLFEELGFNYSGPIDGHDLSILVPTLQNLKQRSGPRLLHIRTVKGKGYAAGEADPVKYHAVSADFNTPAKPPSSKQSTKKTYSKIFGDWLCDMAQEDPKLIGITPAMCEGSAMVRFAEEFPHRYYDVGIAEQHAVTLAAGLACSGKKPVVAIYSTFLQRAYDQLIHDVALQNLDVTFALDRAGLVGDGPTHAGIFDLSYLRCIPNMVVIAPSDENECRQLLYTAYQYPGPAAVRYPRGSGLGITPETRMQALPIGKGQIKRTGEKIALLVFGTLLSIALEAAEQLNATVADMRFVKPLDEELVRQLAADHTLLVTLEEQVIAGGAGSAVNECLAAQANRPAVLNLGLADCFPQHGDPKQQLASYGLSVEGLIKSVRRQIT